MINDKIHLIKIDVNGYEYEIIKCLKKQITKDLPLLVIENNKELKKISNYLEKFGYKKYYNSKGKLKKYTNQNVLDIFFIIKK